MLILVIGFAAHSWNSPAEALYCGNSMIEASQAPAKALAAGKNFARFGRVIPEQVIPMMPAPAEISPKPAEACPSFGNVPHGTKAEERPEAPGKARKSKS